MIGFTLPLYVLLGVELVIAANLLMPLPASRPAIALIKATKSDVGRSVIGTVALFLVVLMASPVYDMWALHLQKERSADSLLSQERRYDPFGCAYCSTTSPSLPCAAPKGFCLNKHRLCLCRL